MAAVSGLAASSVGLIWRNHGLKPHLVRGFNWGTNKRFVEKLEEIVGLYLNDAEHALVLSCDEISQIQALDRSQPGLTLRQGKVATQTHDYKRHGTTTQHAQHHPHSGFVPFRSEPLDRDRLLGLPNRF